MPNIAEDVAFDNGVLAEKEKAASEIQTFQGAAKQYVRGHGWLEHVKDFTSRRAEAGITTPFKYLTLPGPNMTDIGVLWNAGLIEPIDGQVNIAICDREHAELVVGLLRGLGLKILAYSKELLHEALKSKKSTLREHFPFDVINLDLCNALVTGTRRYSNLDALQWIFRFQRGQRFLLLLTTRANQQFDADLVRLLKHNYENEPGFKEAYDSMVEETKVDPLEDSTLFSRLVFPKLIAKYAVTYGYKVIEHFAAYYSRPMSNDRTYDMLAHTFELQPLKPTQEPFSPSFENVPQNEHQEKTRILLANQARVQAQEAYSDFVKELPIKGFINVDQLLDQNPALKATMQSEDDALSGWWKRAKDNPSPVDKGQ